jgi:MFS family permease
VSHQRQEAYLYAARAARGFGDGFAAIILPAYLIEMGFNPFQIGLVAAAALLGSAALTLGIGIFGARFDLRVLLIACAGLMVATGIGIPIFSHLGLILIVAFIGTINPTMGDIGIHVPLEHAALARGASDEERTRVFARYSLIGALSIAFGALAAGAPDILTSFGIGKAHALQAMFFVYAALGLVSAAIYTRLPRAKRTEEAPAPIALGASRRTVYKLAALFSVDSFAGGFTVQSLLALWLFERFELALAAASVFFFWSSVLSAFSYPIAAWLGKHFGLVNTMVFTHIPSSICLIVAAFSSNLTFVLGLLLLRSALAQMDVPTRTSYVMAVVTPPERTAAASITAVPRSLASAISPAISGAFLSTSYLALPLVICGVLKITYDLTLLYYFRHVKPPEEKTSRGKESKTPSGLNPSWGRADREV